MTDTTLPAPLVPADVDLRGLEYMPLLGDRLLESDFNLDANDAEFRIGLRLWWKAWKQVPAASLPNNDDRLCKLAGLDENRAKWRKVKAQALAGFIECSDGRLYHPIVAKQALIAWEKRGEYVAEKEGNAERKRRERDERAQMFASLKAAGVTPKWDTKTTELRKMVAALVTSPVTSDVTKPVTVTVTANTGRDGTGREEDNGIHGRSNSDRGGSDPDGFAPTKAGEVGKAFKRAGVSPTQCNLDDPRLAELLRQGATVAEFEGLAREAVTKGIDRPFPWVLATLPARRADASRISLPAGQSKQSALESRNAAVAAAFKTKPEEHSDAPQ